MSTAHPWEPQPGSEVAELLAAITDLYTRLTRLQGGLLENRAEFNAYIHRFQAVALEAMVAPEAREHSGESPSFQRRPSAPSGREPLLFAEEELAALRAIDHAAEMALRMTSDEATGQRIGDARLGLRVFVFQAARQRTKAPGASRWYRGTEGSWRRLMRRARRGR